MECNEVQMTITAIWTPSPDSSQAARTMAYYTYNGECSLVRIETKSFILAQKRSNQRDVALPRELSVWQLRSCLPKETLIALLAVI